MLREAVPVFFSVIVCTLLVVLTGWLAKLALVLDKLTSGEEEEGLDVELEPEPELELEEEPEELEEEPELEVDVGWAGAACLTCSMQETKKPAIKIYTPGRSAAFSVRGRSMKIYLGSRVPNPCVQLGWSFSWAG